MIIALRNYPADGIGTWHNVSEGIGVILDFYKGEAFKEIMKGNSVTAGSRVFKDICDWASYTAIEICFFEDNQERDAIYWVAGVWNCVNDPHFIELLSNVTGKEDFSSNERAVLPDGKHLWIAFIETTGMGKKRSRRIQLKNKTRSLVVRAFDITEDLIRYFLRTDGKTTFRAYPFLTEKDAKRWIEHVTC